MTWRLNEWHGLVENRGIIVEKREVIIIIDDVIINACDVIIIIIFIIINACDVIVEIRGIIVDNGDGRVLWIEHRTAKDCAGEFF